jgi:uncharacterized protein (TIGR02646 family)
MRFIPKPAGSAAEACINGFVAAQNAGRADGTSWEILRLDYGSFTRTNQLRELLTDEQKGLCAYTGVWLNHLAIRNPQSQEYWYQAHIEHLKSQHQCRMELEARGGVFGRDLGEDLAYSNLVAAIEVAGSASEHFGAAYRGNKPLPMIPTMPDCETAFVYTATGDIFGNVAAANTTIENLKLDHDTLIAWRRGAIDALLPLGDNTPRETLQLLIQALEDNTRESLKEFSFVVAQVARAYLAIQNSRT